MSEYIKVHESESFGTFGENGIQIHVKVDREISKDERWEIRQKAEEISKLLMGNTIDASAVRIRERASQRQHLLALFPERIFVEEIPNGYCSDYCCKTLPWFQITTTFGRVTIGWRKRVIHISWKDSLVALTAEMLFPKETCTKSGQMIHASDYDTAKRYIDKLYEVAE